MFHDVACSASASSPDGCSGVKGERERGRISRGMEGEKGLPERDGEEEGIKREREGEGERMEGWTRGRS